MTPVACVKHNIDLPILRHFQSLFTPVFAAFSGPAGFPEKCPLSRFSNELKCLKIKNLGILLNALLPAA
jgi:hypothetical protein